MRIRHTGEGKVVLIAGGDKIYTDIAARFVRSERELDDIISSPYDKHIVQNIIRSGHLAAMEFDYYLFGVEGYSRVTETQLVRKRMASYLIKSGRCDLHGKREFDIVYPKSLDKLSVTMEDGTILTPAILAKYMEYFYNAGLKLNYPEEDLRYFKPQATVFKGIIGMNAHALKDFFRVRCCMNAQHEIRDMANKMLKLCKQVSPDLFADAGPNCKVLGYCPENDYQNAKCKGKVLTKDEAFKILKNVPK